MTNNSLLKEKPNKIHIQNKKISALFTVTVSIAAFLLSLLFSERIAHSVRSSLQLCANVIIPSVFPFMILADLLYAYSSFSSLKCIGTLFERLFKINRSGLYPFMLGALCGFPLGVKCASELYRRGELTKDEAERLIGFCNNTGPAFLVSGIGVGLRNNIYEGFLLYFAMIISAVLVGVFFSGSKKSSKRADIYDESHHHFSFTESVRSAGISTLGVCSYLTFFVKHAIRECLQNMYSSLPLFSRNVKLKYPYFLQG